MGALKKKKKKKARIVDCHSFECSISVVFLGGLKRGSRSGSCLYCVNFTIAVTVLWGSKKIAMTTQ